YHGHPAASPHRGGNGAGWSRLAPRCGGKRRRRMRAALLSSLVTAAVVSAAPLPGVPELKAAADQLIPTPMTVELGGMPAAERKALARLVQAARVMDPLFLRQSWAGSEGWVGEVGRGC